MEQKIDMKAVKSAAKQEFSNVSGIEGFGIGDRSLNIYIDNQEVQKQLPSEFQGVPINCIVTGEISVGSSRVIPPTKEQRFHDRTGRSQAK